MTNDVTSRTGVLFVCLGNICRSPLAEAGFRKAVTAAGLADRFLIDSAGTSDYNAGEAPDPRAVAAGAKRGFDLSALRARQLRPSDFLDFDWILAMDAANLAAIEAARPDHALARVALYLDVAEGRRTSVPDPYFGGRREFEEVADTVDRASGAILRALSAAVPGDDPAAR